MYTSALNDTELGTTLSAFAAGLMGALLLISRIASWLHGLILTRNISRSTNSNESLATWFNLVFLHSGPWLLIGAGWTTYYLVVHVKPTWLLPLGAGACVAFIFLIVAGSLSYQRQKQAPKATPVLLTQQEIKTRTRRHFWTMSIFYGAGLSGAFIYELWEIIHSHFGLLVFLVAVSMGAGCLGSFFMTAWYESALQAREVSRKRSMMADHTKRAE